MVNSQHPKHVYVVLGMARSGTSTIARSLNTLDIELGDQLAPPRMLWNPKGFFEDTDVVYKINRALMHTIHFSWKSINNLDRICFDSPEVSVLKKNAIQLLKKRFSKYDHWGFKDPRTAKLLPFWQEVFRELGLKEHYIIVCRNPLASAYSYQRVSGADIEFGLLLSLLHLIPAIENTENKHRIFVGYEQMLQNPTQALKRMAIALQRPLNEEALTKFHEEFLDHKLEHFNFTLDDLKAHSASAVAPYISQLYELLSDLAQNKLTPQDQKFNATWRSIRDEFYQNYALLCYLDVWIKRYKNLERELRGLKRSLFWGLTIPVRYLERKIRHVRRTAKIKKRLFTTYE